MTCWIAALDIVLLRWRDKLQRGYRRSPALSGLQIPAGVSWTGATDLLFGHALNYY